jgi:hypothetical protein
MSAETMRQAARYAIEARMADLATEISERHGDPESAIRVNMGRYAGLQEAIQIIDEQYKRLGQ